MWCEKEKGKGYSKGEVFTVALDGQVYDIALPYLTINGTFQLTLQKVSVGPESMDRREDCAPPQSRKGGRPPVVDDSSSAPLREMNKV